MLNDAKTNAGTNPRSAALIRRETRIAAERIVERAEIAAIKATLAARSDVQAFFAGYEAI
jgi:hypothetical protein